MGLIVPISRREALGGACSSFGEGSMQIVKAIGLGLLMGFGSMFSIGFVNVILGVESSIAGAIEGLVFIGGFALGMVLILIGNKPVRLTVPPEEWGKPRQ
jgi:hypothetical protein